MNRLSSAIQRSIFPQTCAERSPREEFRVKSGRSREFSYYSRLLANKLKVDFRGIGWIYAYWIFDRRIVNKFILSSTSSFFSSSTPACRGQFPEKEKRKREKDRRVIFFDEEVSKASLKPRACIRMCVYIEIRVLL